MIAFLVTAFYAAGIIAAIDAVMTVRTSQGAIAWSVSLVSFPFVAVPAYLVLGRSKFQGQMQAFALRQGEIRNVLETYRSALRPFEIEPEAAPSWHHAVRQLSEHEVVSGNQVELLVNGDQTFESILQGIAAAERYILFQFYMIHDDALGNRVQKALIERARAGVQVVVLYDEIGSKGLSDSYIQRFRDAGIAVSSFKPNQGWQNRFQLNFRNHRKIVVVDGKVAWIGGHNVGDEYLGLDAEYSPWRDTHVRLEGPAALQAQLTVMGDWYWASREELEVNWTPHVVAGANQHVLVLPTSPVSKQETASLLFVAALNAAKERIWLTAPYFVPDDAVLKSLQLAAMRGVDVRIITSGKGDSLPVWLAAFYYINQLRDTGIRFYAYQPGFLHQKVMLVDDDVASVGTHNFDNRSFRLNFEVMAAVFDKKFASEVETMLLADFDHASIIDPRDFEQKPFFWWLGVRLSYLAAPVL
ncbi:MAG TPA: cardiolipin synthase [Xanthomonadales bacterium]|nr:cardiolipin synthase [Xanthomonadales bacterium]